MTRAHEVRKALEVYGKTAGGYVDMQRLLIRYGMECFLRRLASSRHRDKFILKGAMSFAIYIEGARNTKDSDFQVYGRHDGSSLRRAFEEICSTALDDGIQFSLAESQLKAQERSANTLGSLCTFPPYWRMRA